MPDILYDLIFDGIVAGYDPVQVKAAFGQLFKLEQDRVERVFASHHSVLKSKVDAVTADKYIARLASLGIKLSKRAIEIPTSDTAELSLTPAAPGPQATSANTAAMSGIAVPAAAVPFAATATSQRVRHIPFEFSGKGFEYFKIWIVNILLSIVTLGIYSAWAKVRNKQYFYGNTAVDSTRFEYTAQPLKILKGRLIAAGFYLAYSLSTHTSPILSLVLGLLMMIFLPWIIVNSLKFNARHTSYRNINFRFVGTRSEAVKAYMLWPLLGMLTLGMLLPFSWKKQAAFITNNHRYGTAPFAFDVRTREYYKVLFVLMGGTILFFAAMFIYIRMFTGLSMGIPTHKPAFTAMLPIIIAYMVFYLAVSAYYITSLANIHFNNTQLEQHRFSCNWSTMGYARLLLVNTLGILFTLGLFIPFAKVRTAAYKAAHTTLIINGDLAGFIAAEQEQSNSLAEGVHDIFDIDISL
ncbi:MAG: YjgN family protein [Sulfuriferula sp.]|nr:YjgN family protein [Sulfuriferula sp.]